MLAIKEDKSKVSTCRPNILPCRIHHNGQVNASSRHWDPRPDENQKEQAYFRGRKLQGHIVKVPQGYQGVVVEKSDRILPQTTLKTLPSEEDDNGDEDDEVEEDVKILPQVASFGQFTVWAHESVPANAEDPYIKGVDEWMAFAQAMNSYDLDGKH